MLVSRKWLEQYVNLDGIDTQDLAEDITKSGLEVEEVVGPQLDDENLVVGYVEKCEQHPNADKLSLCQVDVGEEELSQIACGAPNVAEGQYVVVAKPGTRLPGGLKIKKAKLRGEASEGMICSLQELGIEDKFVKDEFKDGIYVFQDDVTVGEPACPLLNLDDEIIEIELTANRSDCLSMIGVAYEVAAVYDKDIELPEPTVLMDQEPSSDYISVHIDNETANPYYGAWMVKDITIKPSPLWLQNRLISAGIRPINNVVDVTNYILLEYGQPLHAFDYERFDSKEVVTRLAKEGETIKTLDGEERTLSSDQLVITNGKEAHAIAGVMGGEESEVQDDTKTVLLEAAYFKPQVVRKASKDHGIRSEASSRYEKGIDITRVKEAATRAVQLLSELGNGKVLGEIVEEGSTDWDPAVVTFTKNEINDRIGADISLDEMVQIIERLRFDYEVDGDTVKVIAPARRQDIAIKEDMVEEIARLFGYDNIPYTLPQGVMDKGGLTTRQNLIREVHRYMQKAGLNESLTYSLTKEEWATKFVSPEIQNLVVSPVALKMPMTDLHSHLRLSAIPELLSSVQYNVARNQYNVALYEVGSIYLQKQPEVQPEQNLRLSAAVTGLWESHPWQGEKKPIDFFVIKGALEGFFDHLLEDEVTFEKAELDGLHPGRTAVMKLKDDVIGFVGQVHPAVQKDYDLQETYIFDLNLDKVFDQAAYSENYRPITKYPAIAQDLAFVVDRDLPAKQLEDAILQQGQPHLESVQVFDVYQGEHMEEGKKSIAFSLLFQNDERTLKDEEIEEARKQIVTHLESHYQAVLRG
ncbi:phenylalanine--tRNA ligase subunit beta [Tenuibacillus multivorans]|uniref:Phenylalanine--tRNA ligase beta subunit n=1 Tax=Tenuibacillus multivorans TaxID=237069 RepID=A0A1G9ZR59_9BACI|nr:phenylalanine--tRNA ligase subunit beta [Tenuibacillus multivorans]GEL76817.1 phenylalanine--tRNA ligase beta subunit [Tenuibacillus multivorans]SDN23674.1 phenylalanyl-tRNA synthetase beta chain [Tenuibacillus multivorans]